MQCNAMRRPTTPGVALFGCVGQRGLTTPTSLSFYSLSFSLTFSVTNNTWCLLLLLLLPFSFSSLLFIIIFQPLTPIFVMPQPTILWYRLLYSNTTTKCSDTPLLELNWKQYPLYSHTHKHKFNKETQSFGEEKFPCDYGWFDCWELLGGSPTLANLGDYWGFISKGIHLHWYEALWRSPNQNHERLCSKWIISYHFGELWFLTQQAKTTRY